MFKDKIKEHLFSLEKGFLEDSFFYAYEGQKYSTEEFKATCVVEHGGEDQGSDYYKVWKFESPEIVDPYIFVKFYGFYQSHYGAAYEDLIFVEPKVKTVTVYE